MKELSDKDFLELVADRLVLFDGYDENDYVVNRLKRMAKGQPVYSNVGSKRRGW